jgi:hypothetical protein
MKQFGKAHDADSVMCEYTTEQTEYTARFASQGTKSVNCVFDLGQYCVYLGAVGWTHLYYMPSYVLECSIAARDGCTQCHGVGISHAMSHKKRPPQGSSKRYATCCMAASVQSHDEQGVCAFVLMRQPSANADFQNATRRSFNHVRSS